VSFLDWLKDKTKIILFDGGMGSELIKRGLPPNTIPGLFNIEQPQLITEIHSEYYKAGSDMCQTCTFGANFLNLKNHKIEDKIEEIKKRALENIKKACPPDRLIVGDLGPTGTFKPPIGKATIADWQNAYLKQVKILENGVDLWHVETISDIDEMVAALNAIKEISSKPIIASITYKMTKRGFFTIMGDSLEKCINVLEENKVNVIGANCTLGSSEMVELAKEMVNLTSLPVSIKPNAGKPKLDSERKVIYEQTIEEFVRDIEKIIELGAKIVGGCCGTTPKTIAAIKKILNKN